MLSNQVMYYYFFNLRENSYITASLLKCLQQLGLARVNLGDADSVWDIPVGSRNPIT